MRTIVIMILLLIMVSVSLGSDEYWADPNGSDGGAGTEASPWQTINGAMGNADVLSNDWILYLKPGSYPMSNPYYINSTLNGDKWAIKNASRKDPITYTDDPNLYILESSNVRVFWVYTVSGEDSNGMISGVTVRSSNTGSKWLVYSSTDNDGFQFTIDHCIFGEKDSVVAGINCCVYYTKRTTSPPTLRKLKIEDSYLYSKDSYHAVLVYDTILEMNRNVVDRTNAIYSSSYACVMVDGNMGSVLLDSVHFKNHGVGFRNYTTARTSATNLPYIYFNNCNFDTDDYGIYIPDYAQNIVVTNCYGRGGLMFGNLYDYPQPYGWELGPIYIYNCQMVDTNDGSDSTSLIGLGLCCGVQYAYVGNSSFLYYPIFWSNKSHAAIYGDVIVEDCNFVGGRNGAADTHGGYWRSAYNTLTRRCYFRGTGKHLLYLFDQTGFERPDGTATDWNVITNCIFDASYGSDFCISLAGGNQIRNNIFDFNCYVKGSGGIFEYYNPYNLSEWRTLWGTLGNNSESKKNDIHSINPGGQNSCYRFIKPMSRPRIDGGLMKGLVR